MAAAARPGTPTPLGEIRDRFRAAEQAETGTSRERYLEALEAFLSTAERNEKALVGEAAEVAPLVDDAAMAFYRASRPELARRAIDLGLRLSPAHPSLLHHKALTLLALNENLPEALKLVDQALAATPHDKGLWATKGDALRLMGKNPEAARAYVRAQRADAASTQYVDKALKLVPNDPEALRLKVELARAGGDTKALQASTALVAENPEDLELLRVHAELLVAVGRPTEAIAPLSKVREKRPGEPATELLYAQTLAAAGRGDEAWPIAQALVEPAAKADGPTLEGVARLAAPEHPAIALAARDRLREVEPRNVQNLHDLRSLAVRAERPEAALVACRAILEVSPDNLEAWRGVADLEAAAGHVDAALAAYRSIGRGHPQAIGELSKALEYAGSVARADAVREFAAAILAVDPKDARARLEFARALSAAGDATGAAAAYDALIAQRPGELALLIEKKDALLKANAAAEVGPVLDELFRLDPTRTDIAVERGNLYLARAYDLPEGTAGRETAARGALESYERASTDAEAADVSRLGIARASRLVDDRERAVRSYGEFLAVAGNAERADIREELARTLEEAGRFAEAEAEYEKVIAAGRDDPELFWGAVEVYAALGKDAPALRLLDLLLTREPTNALYLRRKGQLLLRAGRRDEALRTLQDAVKSASGDPHALFDVAEALRTQGAYPDAIQYYRRGLALEPANRHGRVALAETLLLAGQYSEVIAIVDPLLKEDANDLAAWKARADAARALGRASEVLYSLQAVLLLEPDDATALLEMYRLRRQSGEKGEALAALTRLLRSNAPEAQDPSLQLERGDLAAELGEPAEANAAYERAAAIDPAFRAEVALRRARLRLSAGRPDLALEMLDEGHKALPAGGSPGLAALLLRAEILTALERPAEARAVYEEVRQREPRSPVAVAGVGHSMITEGRHADAAEFLHGVLPQLPPQETLYLELAEAESGLGHLDLAAAAVSQGVQALPKSVALWSRLGEISIARQLWSDAANALAHAIALAPTAHDLLLRAGFVALRLEHPNEALALYERATQAAPTDKQAWTSHGLALLAVGRPTEAQTSFDRALAIDSDFGAAKDGKKLAFQKTRDAQVNKHGREALLLEAKLHRPITKNDLFVTLHVPFEFLDPVLAAVGQTPKLDLKSLKPNEARDLEGASYQLITAALDHRPPGIERRGLSLADVAALVPPAYSLDQIQRLFGYLRAVLEAEIAPEDLTLNAEAEELARRALTLPPEQRTLFQLVKTLRVGVLKARVIKTIEEIGATVRPPTASLDLGAYSPEFRAPATPAPAPEGERYFAPENVSAPAAAPSGTPASRPATAPHPAGPHPQSAHAGERGSGSRCVACGGLASHMHSCGAHLCQTCVDQYPKCPKCGHPVAPGSLRPFQPAPADPSTVRGAPPGTTTPTTGHAGPRRPKPTGGSGARPTSGPDPESHPTPRHDPAPPHSAHPAHHLPDHAKPPSVAHESAAPASAAAPAAPPAPPPSTPKTAPPDPPEAAPKPKREKVDSEPRL